MKKIEGGITAAKGFQAAGGAAGIKKHLLTLAQIFRQRLQLFHPV